MFICLPLLCVFAKSVKRLTVSDKVRLDKSPTAGITSLSMSIDRNAPIEGRVTKNSKTIIIFFIFIVSFYKPKPPYRIYFAYKVLGYFVRSVSIFVPRLLRTNSKFYLYTLFPRGLGYQHNREP